MIRGGDYHANMAYFCLHEFKLLPTQYLRMSRAERAFVCAAVEVCVEERRRDHGDH